MSFFTPDEYLHSVTDIDPVALRACGVETVLLDLDNTLKPRDSREIPAENLAWTEDLRAAGFKLCLVSNSWQETIFGYGEQLGMPVVWKSMKPFPFAFNAGIRKVGGRKETTVAIGDQLVTDAWGAHIARIPVIMVPPLCDTDLPHMRVFRKIERPIMARATLTEALTGRRLARD